VENHFDEVRSNSIPKKYLEIAARGRRKFQMEGVCFVIVITSVIMPNIVKDVDE
jgi:hypothetical protein